MGRRKNRADAAAHTSADPLCCCHCCCHVVVFTLCGAVCGDSWSSLLHISAPCCSVHFRMGLPPICAYCASILGVRLLLISGPSHFCSGPSWMISPSLNRRSRKGPTSGTVAGPPILSMTTAVPPGWRPVSAAAEAEGAAAPVAVADADTAEPASDDEAAGGTVTDGDALLPLPAVELRLATPSRARCSPLAAASRAMAAPPLLAAIALHANRATSAVDIAA